ncbi:MAG: hypothetical protein P8Y78_02365 [Acidihalobacter sp.]|jgi:uncharacterized membrane protein
MLKSVKSLLVVGAVVCLLTVGYVVLFYYLATYHPSMGVGSESFFHPFVWLAITVVPLFAMIGLAIYSDIREASKKSKHKTDDQANLSSPSRDIHRPK